MTTTIDLNKLICAFDAIEVETGKRISIQTLSRKAKSGELKAKKVFGRWMCTRQDVLDYIELETDAAINGSTTKLPVEKTRSEIAREKAIAIANADLEAAGI